MRRTGDVQETHRPPRDGDIDGIPMSTAGVSRVVFETPVMPHESSLVEPDQTDPARWVEAHADALYAYALSRVGRPELAEDLVQEALLAALEGRGSFRGDAQERTWLIGILRHKIIDHFRAASTRREHQPRGDADGRAVESWFDEKGRWRRMPGRWQPRPDQLEENREFWAVLGRCVETLPERPRQVFTRRVMEQEQTQTVCKELGISSTNLWVVLHRARAMLRACLEKRWFSR